MKTTSATILRVFLPFATGYFFSYLYRAVNAVIAPDLIADIGLTPSALGLLTSIYFISFASFQIPLGILLDRYGSRKVEAALLLVASLGAFFFAKAESLIGLITGRALIGFGVSACLMAAFKAYTQWFQPRNWPLINGFQVAAGGFGALAATAPVEFALLHTDWRGMFTVLSLLTLLTAFLIFIVVPEKKANNSQESLASQFQGIFQIFTDRKFWRLAPITALSLATFTSIQGLWAGPYLSNVALYNRTQIASTLFWVATAMIFGYILLGSLAAKLAKGSIPVKDTAVAGIVIFMLCQLLLVVGPPSFILPIWIIFGFFGTSGILAYSALSQAFPAKLSGRVITAVNLLVFVGAFCCQWLIGIIIENLSPANTYSPTGFRWAFGTVLVFQLLCLIYYIFPGRKPIDD